MKRIKRTLLQLFSVIHVFFFLLYFCFGQDTTLSQNNATDSTLISSPDSSKILSSSNPFIITPDSIMVFTYHDFKIFHLVGDKGLKPNDVIRIQFPPLWLPPQDSNILANNFVYISSSRFEDEPVFEFSAKPKTPVSGIPNNQTFTSFFKLLDFEFFKGDTIIFNYGSKKQAGKGQVTSYLSGTDYLYSVIVYSYESSSEITELKVKKFPAKPHTVKVYAPSNPVIDTAFALKVLVLDKFGNRAYQYAGTIEISNTDGFVSLPEKYSFLPSDSGKKTFYMTSNDTLVHRITVRDSSGLAGLSNPFIAVRTSDTKVWWGDMHSHSIYSNHGAGTPEDLFNYGKNTACLDFLVYSEHSYIPDSLYLKGVSVSNRYNKDFEFVSLNGYEWTAPIQHKVVFFDDENPPPIFRNKSATKLFLSVYASGGSIIAAHPTSYLYYTDWDEHDPLTQKNSEISGLAGNKYEIPSEFTPGSSVQEALEKGHHIGFVGSSDNHHSRPGKNMSNFMKLPDVGITAAYSNQLIRAQIYEAINSRYNYATTGPRILLDFKIDNYRMGSILLENKKYPLLAGKIYAQDSIETVEIIKNNAVLKEYKPNGMDFIFTEEDTLFNGDSYYYLRIIQKNKHMAWSSPVWVNMPITLEEKAEIYGKNFFNKQQTGYSQKSSDTKVPENYTLGPGDKISISISGTNEYNEIFTIGADGTIQTKETGNIALNQIKFKDARILLKNKFETGLHLKNTSFSITLAKARVITVHLSGEVKNPGSYSFPAVNSAFNMLTAAGGINPIGTIRNIQVFRKGKLVKTLDLYDFLLNPSSTSSFFLEDNDYLKIPPTEKIVNILGKIKRPGLYELRKSEGLNELISYVGSFEPSAYTRKLILKRYDADLVFFKDVPYDSCRINSKNFPLKDGDEILVQGIPEGAENYVEIEGAVKFPGKYAITDSMHVSDLISRAEGITKDYYPNQAFLVRVKDDFSLEFFTFSPEEIIKNKASGQNFLLREEDLIHIFSKKDFLNEFAVEISGSVRNPGEYTFTEGMTLKDLILLGGGFLESAYLKTGYAFRIKKDMSREYLPISFDTNRNYLSLDTFKLKHGDRIRVFSKDYFLDDDSVRISGPVRAPGTYYYSEGMTLEDILFLAGGLRKEAADYFVEVARMTFFENRKSKHKEPIVVIKTNINHSLELDSLAGEFILLPNDHVKVRKDPDFEYPENVLLEGEVIYPGAYTLKSKSEKVTDLIARAGGLTPFAFPDGSNLTRPGLKNELVPLNLRKAINNPESSFNYFMKDGDKITIPRLNELVTLKGALKFPENNFKNGMNAPYFKGKRAGFYIRKFTAGFNKNASKNNLIVIYPDQSQHQTLNMGLFKIYPKMVMGSVIVVPEKSQAK
ncbi:MAG: hypothetical protein A3H98_10335 [Bacteroidetes bacterium RIFCSPLOWO2_02_FULL_36_8]|nr:MAG: hypothetical protein A3H98_10335 [Bacteroidetes bacterium RIFCSPLOWO2_02_FULL_36_8]OFY70960.1 MAG: hypothetical protein A3G23_12655 [Bacteroidetes bacterium RIFCSPLOWO2_12_FULL_37_12]